MKHIDDISPTVSTPAHTDLKYLVSILRARRSDAMYWIDEDREFVRETNLLAAKIRRASAKLGVLTCASLLLTAIGTGLATASPDELGGYSRVGAGMSRALSTSNHDDPEFGTEPGGFGYIESGGEFVIGPTVSARAGVQGLYAPKDEHGHNDKGCGGSPSCQRSADGETLQAGAITPTAGIVWSPEWSPVSFPVSVNAGLGLRSDDGATYAYGVEGGVEIPIVDDVSFSATYRYTNIGGYEFHGPAIGAVVRW